MKILFISSGNTDLGISPITFNQGESLKEHPNIDLEYFTIQGKGVLGYLKSIIPLRRIIKKNDYQIFHAHYSLSGIVAGIAGAKPLVVSLMGSDTKKSGFELMIIAFFSKYVWNKTIVKSEQMKNQFRNKRIIVLPNGVDFNIFKPLSKEICQDEMGYDRDKKHIVFFLSSPKRKEKNVDLAIKAISLINDPKVEFHVINLVEHKNIPMILNASDLLLLTSFYEGSPNIIKEAMACSIPIVTTDVGDVRKIINNTEGCYISSFCPENIKECIEKSLSFNKRTEGRDNISYLNSSVIANSLYDIYKSL